VRGKIRLFSPLNLLVKVLCVLNRRLGVYRRSHLPIGGSIILGSSKAFCTVLFRGIEEDEVEIEKDGTISSTADSTNRPYIPLTFSLPNRRPRRR
jgi:hypothetical protein